MTDADKYRANFASERLLDGPPYKGCGVSSDWAATDLATLGESSRRPDGRPKQKKARAADLRRGWRGFLSVADDNGIPDTGDLQRIHANMFPDLPSPAPFRTRDFGEVIEQLDDDMAVSIAVRLRVLPPSSSMREYTDADHQVVLYGRKGDTTTRIDPMHVHSLSYAGDRVLLDDVKQAARAIAGGLILCWLYPIGEWTEAALIRKRKNRQLERIEDAAAATEKTLRSRIRELEATIPPDCAQQVAYAHAGGRESAFVAVLQSVQALRTAPEETP